MKRLLTIVGLLVLQTSVAQDLHFAQTAQTPLFINPAAAGVFDGWERAIVNHRSQWLGGGTQFNTTAIAADVNLFKGHLNQDPHLGLGILLFNDVGGDSKFGNQSGALTVSGIIPMGGGHILSAGIQGGFGQRKADLSNVTFMNQWNGSGFDQSILSGEVNTLTSFTYIDASGGLYYVYDGGKSTFSRNNNFKLQIGLAGFHLNKPKLKYINGVADDRLHRKFVAHVGVVADIPGTDLAIDGSAVQILQGAHYETLIGMMLRYRFEDATKVTGNTQDAFIGFGLYGRMSDAIIPSFMVSWRGFQFGVSYDVTLSALRQAYRGGSLEFSLAYTNFDHSLFKTRGRRF